MMWAMATGRKTAFSLELQFGNKTLPRWWGFCFATIELMDKEPDTTNVHFIDEYPHLEEKVRLRRMGQLVLFESEMGNTTLTLYELPEPPDGAA